MMRLRMRVLPWRQPNRENIGGANFQDLAPHLPPVLNMPVPPSHRTGAPGVLLAAWERA